MKRWAYLDAALLLLGAAAIVVGVAQWSRPAAWVTGGLVCIVLGSPLGRPRGR